MAKAGIPEEDAFEILIIARQFPPSPFPKVKGVIIDPDQKIQKGLLSHLVSRGIVTFESAREECCDWRKGENVSLACASEIEKIAAIPEVVKIELRDAGGHLIDEFMEGKRNLLSKIDKRPKKDRPSKFAQARAIQREALEEPCHSFRPR